MWNKFWFTPRSGEMLAVIRICLGLLLLYSQISALPFAEAYFGAGGWMAPEALARSLRYPFNPTWLIWSSGSAWLLVNHIFSILVYACFAAGIAGVVSGPLALVMCLGYINRNEAIIFGFDQVIVGLLICVVMGRHSDHFSLTRLVRRRLLTPPVPSVRTNVAIRLLQLKMCIVYFSAGYFKAVSGWFDGASLWNALVAYETSAMDLRWVARYPFLLQASAMVVVLWELQFFYLIWLKPTRWPLLGLAVATHLGIAVTTELKAFSLLMIAGCLAFACRGLEADGLSQRVCL